MKKVSGWGKQDTAVGFYRVIQPLRFLKREGFVDDCRVVPFSGENEMQNLPIADRVLINIAKDSEAFITTVMFHEDEILRMINLRKHMGAKWFVDMDDNMYDIPNDNPAKAGVTPLLSNLEKCLTLADGVIVSCEKLKDVYSQFNDNIFVLENGADFEKNWNVRRKRNKTDKIRIGWEGASKHKQDLELIYPAINKLKEKYDIEFVSMGHKPAIESEHYPWVHLQDYPQTLAKLEIDINIAPLIDSAYNRCKSNIRVMESAVLGIPSVYSPVENYKGWPGIAATNNYEWYGALEKLITDKKLREKLGREAKQYAKDEYDMKKLIKPFAKWLKNTCKLPTKEL